MVNIRNNKYEYKTITTFFDNKLKKHYYDEIRSIVNNNEKLNDFELSDVIRLMHRFLLISFSNFNSKNINGFYLDFKYVFKEEVEKEKLAKIKLNYEEGLNRLRNGVDLLEMCIEEQNINIAFFEYVLFQSLLFYHLKDFINIPPYLFDYFDKAKDKELRKVFIIGIILRKIKNHETNLKENIVNKYNESIDYFNSIGITEIWMFGSVQSDTYNDFSDIDLVIKTTSEQNEREAIALLSKFNKENFDRKSDIQIYDDFIDFNDSIRLEKILKKNP